MQKPSLICLLLLTLLMACGFITVTPGSTLETRSKTVVYINGGAAANTGISKCVAIYPITPGLVARVKKPPVIAQKSNVPAREKANCVYRIGSGDVLNIVVWDHNSLNSPTQRNNLQADQVSRSVWVDGRGNITYPLTGQIQARGEIVGELQSILVDRLKRYLKNPQITINVTESRPQRISAAGAVTQVGQQPITDVLLTILDAVNQTSGATAEANTQSIKWTYNGVDRIISLQKLIQYGDLTQNHILSHDNIVYVPSDSNSKIFVTGEVGRQAALPLGNHDLTLTHAPSKVGGMDQSIADATGAFIIHKVSDDVQKPIHAHQLNLRNIIIYTVGNESSLRTNNIVYVTTAPVVRQSKMVSRLTSLTTNVNSSDNTFH